MSTESEQSRRPAEPRRRFQFTLRTLLGATAAICMVFATVEMVDPTFAGALVVWAIFGGLYLWLRVFCMQALAG